MGKAAKAARSKQRIEVKTKEVGLYKLWRPRAHPDMSPHHFHHFLHTEHVCVENLDLKNWKFGDMAPVWNSAIGVWLPGPKPQYTFWCQAGNYATEYQPRFWRWPKKYQPNKYLKSFQPVNEGIRVCVRASQLPIVKACI